jgi:putative acetyltransferase
VPLVIRLARLADALAIAYVHHSAVHAIAPEHYGQAVLEQWAPPVELARSERLYREAQEDGAIQLVAELDAAIVGFGNVAPGSSEIVACYVAPAAGRQGIGARLLAELEAVALRAGCESLTLRASLNAANFYRAHGYYKTGSGEHRFANGARMAAMFMRKDLF